MNDLAWLRAAIIGKLHFGCNKRIVKKPSRVNFFGSQAGRRGMRIVCGLLLVALCGELSDAALCFRTGPFTLARVHLEEILGVGLQVL